MRFSPLPPAFLALLMALATPSYAQTSGNSPGTGTSAGTANSLPNTVQGASVTPAAGNPQVQPGFNCPPGQQWAPNTPIPSCVGTPVASAPKPCNGRTLSWTVGSLTCTAPAGATLHGGSTSLIASNGYTGTASFACNNGLWSVTGPTSCTAPPCSPSTLAWTSGGVGCDGPAVSVASGSSTWVSSTNGNSGSAQFACINGYWGAPVGGSCTAPPPATTSGSLQCPGVGGNITWNSGASTCSAFVPAAAVSPGTYSYSSDNGTPGSYQRRCNGNGTWSDLGGTCGSAPPAAVPCPGGTLPWTVGAASCQATIPVSSAGSYTFSSTNGNAGVFTAQCNNDGTWGELGRTCELPPVTPVTCPSNGSYNTWTGTSGAICGGNMPANPVSPGLYTVNNTIATSMGSYTGRCQADGTWAPVFSECDPITVQAPCAAQPFHTWGNCFGAGSGVEKAHLETFTTPNQQAGYSGNADFQCDSGVWKPTASTCTAVATGCEGTRVEWENGSTGTAALTLRFNDSSDACVHAFDYASFFPGNCTAGPSGQCLFPSGMSISIQDATQPRTGSAQLRCTTSGTGIGVWVHSAAATCNSSGASGPITSWFATAGSNTTLTMMIPSSGGNGQFSMPWTGSTTDGSHHSVVLTEANRLANTGTFAGNWAPTFTPSGAIGVSGAVPQVLQGKNVLNWWTNSCTPGDSRSVCQ